MALRRGSGTAGLRLPSGIDVFVFSWPSVSRTFAREAHAALHGYWSDLAESHLRSHHGVGEVFKLMRTLAGESAAVPGRLHLMCQSMGVRILLYGLQAYLRESSEAPQKLFDSVTMAGSDVDSDSFENSKGLAPLKHFCRKVVVYHNSNDRLGFLAGLARPFGSEGARRRMSRQGLLRPGLVPEVDSVDVLTVVKKSKKDKWGHYYARLNRAVIDDAVRVMSGGVWEPGGGNQLPGRAQDTPPNDFRLIETDGAN